MEDEEQVYLMFGSPNALRVDWVPDDPWMMKITNVQTRKSAFISVRKLLDPVREIVERIS